MSDGPIPLIGPDDLKFVPEKTDFTGMVGSELGTLGTNQDGFDAIFNDAAALASSAGAVLDSMDQDLADASFQLPEFDPAVPTNLMASLQPASDAADTALAQFNTDVPPDPTGGTPGGPGTPGCPVGTVVGGLTIGHPDPTPYPLLPNVPPGRVHDQPVMCVNDPPLDTTILVEIEAPNDPFKFNIRLLSGDPAIFKAHNFDPAPIPNGDDHRRQCNVLITPSKAGRFSCVTATSGVASYDEIDQTNVTIVQP
jgi:hypothetical protein